VSKDKVLIISPPFYSQIGALLTLAGEFVRAGHETTVACAPAFATEIRSRGFTFVELSVSRNANTGIAERTRQPRSERKRLQAFLAATRRGSVETLMLQAAHRRRDMFVDPGGLLDRLREIAARQQPDLWVVDQLSYGVTLALYLLNQRFVTFCPGHPSSIPEPEHLFGVPSGWPSALQPEPEALARLRVRAVRVEHRFTRRMNAIRRRIASGRPVIDSAFRLCSPEAVIYNYPRFPYPESRSTDGRSVYMGYCFSQQALGPVWRERMLTWGGYSPKFLIAFGTFLAARTDVVRACIEALQKAYPQALIIAAAGGEAEALRDLASPGVCIESFVPQAALLPEMDLIIHHAGCNSFTEALFFGKPMILLPFSSDQFAIAADAEKMGLAGSLDPNRFTPRQLTGLVAAGLKRSNAALEHWQQHIRGLGPGWAVRQLEKR
jgi:UDP:flavonoid glycosyltransferase YjiC (YdhE family)